MKALRMILVGVVSSALWPLYFGLLASTSRAAPWPRALARPLSLIFWALAVALFVANLAGSVLRPGCWAETALRVPSGVTRQLRRAIGILMAASLLLLPEQLVNWGMLVSGGHPIAIGALGRSLWLAFELVVWAVAYRLVRARSELVLWLTRDPERLGWLGRHRRAAACGLLAAIGSVIALDVRGYSFTAHRLAIAGGQSAALLLACGLAYVLILRAIDNRAWYWIGEGLGHGHGEGVNGVDQPHEMPKRLRNLVRLFVPIVGVLVGAWIWDVDLALFRSLAGIPVLPLHPDRAVTVGDVTRALVTALVTAGAWRYTSTFFTLFVFSRMTDDPGIRFAVVTLCRYAILAVGLMAGLSAVHLGLQQIGMVVAALGVGLGFGLQEIVSNFVSGIILLVERPIRVGDIVTVAAMSGKVDRINIRATTIINADNQSIIVPNREFITGSLVNWTHRDRIVRVTIPLTVAYGTCPDRVSDLLLTISREDDDVLRNPVPMAAMEAFGDWGLRFTLQVYVPDPSVAPRVRHRLSTRIQERFRSAQIEIPMPMHEVHVRAAPEGWRPMPSPESVRRDPASPRPPAPHLGTMPSQAPVVAPNRCVDE